MSNKEKGYKPFVYTAAMKKADAKAAALENAKGIVQQLDALSELREKWESTDYKKANEGLYSLLGQCLGWFTANYTHASNSAKLAVRNELANKLKTAGVRVLDKTTVLMMFVRIVFNSDRKRAHGYAAVISAASKAGIAADDLPAYIIAAGGIEEIKRSEVKSPSANAKKQKIDAAKAEIISEIEEATASAPLATVEIEELTGSYALLLVKPNGNGTADVVGALSDVPESLVESLIARMATARVKQELILDVINKDDKDILATAPSASNDEQMKEAA